MAIERTGVSTAASAASLALELLASVIEVSKPAKQAEYLVTLEADAAALQGAAEEDVEAYNLYLDCVRSTAERGETAAGGIDKEELQRALQGTIDVPMKAARTVVSGIELCMTMRESVRASVATDLEVAAALLVAAARGILLCADVNLRLAGAEADNDRSYAAVRAEREELGRRAGRAANW